MRERKRRPIKNSSGFGLIEVIVAMGLTTILLLAIASMMGTLYKESAAIDEKLARADLEKTLQTALGDGAICTFQFANSDGVSANTFDSTQLTNPDKSPSIDFQYIRAAPSLTGEKLLTANANDKASNFSNSLYISTIELTHIKAGSTPDSWTAEFQVSFDPKRWAKALKPVSVRTGITTIATSPAGAKVISSCNGVAGVAGSLAGVGNTSGPPILCTPMSKLYMGITPNCNNHTITFDQSDINCESVYIGTLCKTQ